MPDPHHVARPRPWLREPWTVTDLGEGAWVAYREGFVPHAAERMSRLVSTLPLAPEELVLFGRTVSTPRLTSWHGDPGCAYAYSGRKFSPRPWTPELDELRRAVCEATGDGFNSVLVNYYRDGRDAMGAHADDERELGPRADDVRIASVSLGAPRRFVMKSRDGQRCHEWTLGGGDLLLMGGTTQRHFRHRVPRTRKRVAPRLNLTFRVVQGRAVTTAPS